VGLEASELLRLAHLDDADFLQPGHGLVGETTEFVGLGGVGGEVLPRRRVPS
jgi:hypothetical protein